MNRSLKNQQKRKILNRSKELEKTIILILNERIFQQILEKNDRFFTERMIFGTKFKTTIAFLLNERFKTKTFENTLVFLMN